MGDALDAAKRYFETFSAGDLDAADAMFADDCSFVMPMGSMSKAQHRGMGEAFRAGMPDGHMVAEHVVDNGNEVFIEGRFVGTHTGDLMSPGGTITASGNKLELRFADYFKTAGASIIEHRTYFDQVEMLQQLGAMSAG